MNIHKGFCQELGKLRRSTVGDVVTNLGVVTVKDNKILNLRDGLNELEQIFYTVDHLVENKLVCRDSHQIGLYVPDFDPDNFIRDSQDRYQVAQMHAMPKFLQDYWGIGLVVNPVYSKFISNGYKTDEEVGQLWNKWLPVGTAVLGSLLTSVLTALLTNSPTCVDQIGLEIGTKDYRETHGLSYHKEP